MKKECRVCIESLGDKSRMSIFEKLLGEKLSMSVNEVVKQFKLSQSTISYHLSKLSEVGLLTNKKKGRASFYKVCKTCPHDKKTCLLQK